MVGRDLDTDHVDILTTYEEMRNYATTHPEIVGHNILGFDWWVLRDCLGIIPPINSWVDTLCMSRIDHSNRDGGHSLGAWGERLGITKPEHEDWSVLSDAMIHRCVEDTKINAKLYRLLKNSINEKQIPWTEVELECFVHWKMKEVERNGFYFDIEQCQVLRSELNDKRQECELQLRELFPSLAEAKYSKGELILTTPTTKRNGELSTRNLGGCPTDWFTDGAPFAWIKWPEVNLNRDAFIKRHLLHAGWKPKVLTPTGEPKLDDELLDDIIHQVGEKYRPYQEWRILNTRITKQIDKWLEFYNENTHRQHGQIISIGTRTHRMAHRDPPITQVPSSDSPYGSECRLLWGAPDNKYLLGCDASGIQLRVSAHYLDSQEWTDELINGDVHQRNADILGCDRPKAKTFNTGRL
jgi:DNA polymerase-1